METKVKFFLNLGTTLSVAVYGVISAFYTELMKPEFEKSGALIAFLFVAILILATCAFSCYVKVLLIMKENE